MIIFVNFLEHLIGYPEPCPVPSALLRDIGVSRFQIEFKRPRRAHH
jgi:hypothetical protein